MIFVMQSFLYLFCLPAAAPDGGQWSTKGRKNQLMQKIAMSQLSAAGPYKVLSNRFEAEGNGNYISTFADWDVSKITPKRKFCKISVFSYTAKNRYL